MAGTVTKKITLDFAVVETPRDSDSEPWGNGTIKQVVDSYMGELTEKDAQRLIGKTVTFGAFKVKFIRIN